MSNYSEFFLERLVLFAPSVLVLLGLLLLFRFAHAWRMAIWQDRFFGIIAEDRKGAAPLGVILSLAATNVLPLPIFKRWWFAWMDRNYGAAEILTVNQRREYVREIFSRGEYDTEVQWWGKVYILLLAPLGEELLFRTILLLLFPSLSIWACIVITVFAVGFGAIHWKAQLALVAEELRAWSEERDSKVRKVHRILATSFTFVLGLLCGVTAVYYQSLWIALAIHVGWNYFVPRLTLILVVYWLRSKIITNWRLWIP
jgi:membrane protease YdiL (CAAX protease family)